MSYGNKYRTVAVCPKCGEKFNYVADLSQLQYNELNEDFVEPYDIVLPHSGDTLSCRLLRVKDRIDIEKASEKIKLEHPNYDGDPSYNLEMERRIMKVNGNDVDFVQVEKYVSDMISMDVQYFHNKIDKESYGVIRLNLTDCTNPKGCDSSAFWVLSADKEFFRAVFDD